MKGKFIALAVLVLAVAYGLAMPYFTVNDMRAAARERDAAALSAHIDFASVRQSFKDQFAAKVEGKLSAEPQNAFARVGADVLSNLLGGVIDMLVTPEGIRRLMSGVELYSGNERERQVQRNDRREPFANASRRYESPNRFVTTVKTEDGEPIDFVLHRRGLGWKLAEIRLPLQEEG